MGRSAPVSVASYASARPDYHQLATFLKVVETRSFSGAARSMNRTQPAVSQAIVRLEEICGGDLFQRVRGSPLNLTPVGEAIVPSARAIVETIDRQMAEAVLTATGRRGRLALGFSGDLMAPRLQAGIRDFIGDRPEVELQLFEGGIGKLDRKLLDHELDLVIAAGLPQLDSPHFTRERLWQERLFVALPAGHALGRRPAVGWRDLASSVVLVRAAEPETALLRQRLALAGVPEPDLRVQRISRDALLAAVAIGLGVAIVTESGCGARAGVAFLPVDEIDAVSIVEAAWVTEDRNPLRHRLLGCIQRHCRAADGAA